MPFFQFTATQYFGVKASEDDVKDIFMQIDDDFDAVIDFSEFLFFCVALDSIRTPGTDFCGTVYNTTNHRPVVVGRWY